MAQDGAQRLADQIERAAFVAESVTPSAGASRLARRVPAIGDGSGAGDGDDARPAARGAGQRNVRVARNEIVPGANPACWAAALTAPPIAPMNRSRAPAAAT